MPSLRYLPRYTVDDYRQWQGDWELWSGVAIAMTPSPFARHQFVASRLITELGVALRGSDFHVLNETDWIVANDTVVRPDVVVIEGEIPDGHLRTSPRLVAEVISETTRAKDWGVKRELYEREGVEFYLILDPKDGQAELFRSIHGQYERQPTTPSIEIPFSEHSIVQFEASSLFQD